jgi:hypothetical protein
MRSEFKHSGLRVFLCLFDATFEELDGEEDVLKYSELQGNNDKFALIHEVDDVELEKK